MHSGARKISINMRIFIETINFTRPSKLVANLIMLSQDTTCVILSEILSIYTNMIQDYPFKFLQALVDYVARASVLRAPEKPRASGIS